MILRNLIGIKEDYILARHFDCLHGDSVVLVLDLSVAYVEHRTGGRIEREPRREVEIVCPDIVDYD